MVGILKLTGNNYWWDDNDEVLKNCVDILNVDNSIKQNLMFCVHKVREPYVYSVWLTLLNHFLLFTWDLLQ